MRQPFCPLAGLRHSKGTQIRLRSSLFDLNSFGPSCLFDAEQACAIHFCLFDACVGMDDKSATSNDEKGPTVKKWSIAAILTMCAALALAGCATGGGSNPADDVAKQADAFVKGLQAQKIDDVMGLFSENFKNYEWQDKAGAKEFLSQAADQGYLEDIKPDMTSMKISVEGDKATAYPIELNGSFGTVTVELTLAKEAAGWLIVGLDASGI